MRLLVIGEGIVCPNSGIELDTQNFSQFSAQLAEVVKDCTDYKLINPENLNADYLAYSANKVPMGVPADKHVFHYDGETHEVVDYFPDWEYMFNH